MEQIGYIGLGAIGFGMVKNLLKAGNKVMIANRRSKDVVEKLVSMGAVEATKEEIAKAADILFICVTNGKVTEEILFGKDGIAEKMKPGSIFVEHGSISPKQARDNAARLAEYGVEYVDCPVSGAEEKSLAGTLALMAGASEKNYARLLPYFKATGIPVRIGNIGSGCICKYVSQAIVATEHIIIGETFHMAAVGGADPRKVYECIREGAAGSFLLDRDLPMILKRDFSGKGPVWMPHKDMWNLLETCQEWHCPMPMTAQTYEILHTLFAMGKENDDTCGAVQYYEAFDGIVVKDVKEDE